METQLQPPPYKTSRGLHLFGWLIIALIFRIPTRTPYEQHFYIFEAALFPLATLILSMVAWKILFHRAPLYKLSILLLCLFAIPIMGMITSKANFGQPYILTFLTQRQMLSILWVVVIFEALNQNIYSTRQIVRYILIAGWVTLGYWYYIYLFIDFDTFSRLGGWIIQNPLRGTRLRVDLITTAFLLVFYTASLLKRVTTHSATALALGLFYLLIISNTRQYVLAYLLTAAFIIADKGVNKKWRTVKYLWVSLLIIPPLLIGIILFFPEIYKYVAYLYGTAFRVVILHEPVPESSANARIAIFNEMWPYIKENYIWGTGRASRRWIIDQNSIGAGRHPTDLGILGFIYNYGIVGLTIFVLPFLYRIRTWWNLDIETTPPEILACKYYIVLYAILCLTGNVSFEWPATPFLCLILLVHHQSLKAQPQ